MSTCRHIVNTKAIYFLGLSMGLSIGLGVLSFRFQDTPGGYTRDSKFSENV